MPKIEWRSILALLSAGLRPDRPTVLDYYPLVEPGEVADAFDAGDIVRIDYLLERPVEVQV